MTRLALPIAHIIYQSQPLALPAGKAYAFVMAGSGLYKFASNQHLEALIPLHERLVPGLPPLLPYVHLKGSDGPLKLSGRLLRVVLDDARKAAQSEPIETMYHFYMLDGEVRIKKPRQRGDGRNVTYAGGNESNVVLDLHSHHELGAFFSGTDTADEQGFRLYATIGKIFSRPEIALRVGVYGEHWRLPVNAIFKGALPFVDANPQRRR